jgi:serralysin
MNKTGTFLDDSLLGTESDDQLSGLGGNDTLDGGSGNDRLAGGEGNDHYIIRDLHTELYDSSGVDTGLIYVDFYKTNTDVENWSWAPGVQKLPYWIDSLLPGDAPGYAALLASGKTLYYCFPNAAPLHFSSDDRDGFMPFNAQQKAFARQALAYISSVIDVRFVETVDAGAPATIVLANNAQDTSSGYAYYPYPEAVGSDVFLDTGTSKNLSPQDGTYAALTLIHELGHALGLKHPFARPNATGGTADGPYLSAVEEISQWSVMSYIDRPEEYHLRYSPFDLAALQYLYGPSTAVTANNVYTLRTDATNFIWDGGGIDTIDGSGATQSINLYLEPGYRGYIGSMSSLISTAGQITVNFGTVIENAKGGSGSDVLVGNSADNQLIGGDGNDTLKAYAGNNVLDGGNGLDAVVVTDARSEATLTKTSTGFSLQHNIGSQGTDTLINIERILFSDTALAFDIDGIAGQAYRLYQAAFNRQPDLHGLGYWINYMEKGLGLTDVSWCFQASTEFQSLYGTNVSNAQLLTLLYQNVLHRAPDAAGFDYWMNILDTGQQSRPQILICFSESPENQAQIIGSVQNGIEYKVFV